MNTQKSLEATTTATGVVGFFPQGLPAHLKPSAPRNPEGPDVRANTVQHVFVEGMPNKQLTVILASTGSVTFEGCNGDPDVAGNWQPIGSAITASGTVADTAQRRFVRANVTNAGTGVTLFLTASSE